MSTETGKTQASNTPLEPTTLSVQGMTCSSCVNSVEKALNSVEGVSATINFATETAHILAPAEITAKDLIKINSGSCTFYGHELAPSNRYVDP